MATRASAGRALVWVRRAVLAVAPLLGLAGPAFAGDIYIDNVQLFYSETVTITGTVDGSAVNMSGLAGQIIVTANNGVSASTSQYILPVWCVDLFHDISLGQSGIIYSLGGLATDNSDDPTALSQQQMNEMASLAAYGNAQMALDPSNQLSAEVQAAIWTVEYTNSSLGNSLAVSGSDFTAANVANLIATAGQSSATAIQLIALSGTQSLVEPIPEPASGGLLVAGLFALGFARRRRRVG
jgi:hypothetical protein